MSDDLNVFDPSRHKIVAVDRDGSHLHVTLAELALDAAGIDLGPLVQRIAALERERVERERSMQEIVAIADGLSQRLQRIEGALILMSDAAERKLRA